MWYCFPSRRWKRDLYFFLWNNIHNLYTNLQTVISYFYLRINIRKLNIPFGIKYHFLKSFSLYFVRPLKPDTTLSLQQSLTGYQYHPHHDVSREDPNRRQRSRIFWLLCFISVPKPLYNLIKIPPGKMEVCWNCHDLLRNSCEHPWPGTSARNGLRFAGVERDSLVKPLTFRWFTIFQADRSSPAPTRLVHRSVYDAREHPQRRNNGART